MAVNRRKLSRSHKRRLVDMTNRDCRVVDRMVEAYVAWREACYDVSDTYLVWCRAPSEYAGAAFVAYCASLDKEERAARAYEAVVRRVGARLLNAIFS